MDITTINAKQSRDEVDNAEKTSLIDAEKTSLVAADLNSRLPIPNMRESFRESQEFSLSSMISSLSKLLGENNSSSFLFHVDTPNASKIAEPIDKRQKETLRQVIEMDQQCSRDIFKDQSSFIRDSTTVLGKGCYDSWSNFDQIMDKSLPPKEFEIQEFEEYQRNSQSPKFSSLFGSKGEEQDLGEFVDAAEAKKRLDKEEEERCLFIKFSNASNFSTRASPIPLMSVTDYFIQRSDFPVDNCANDSTMFLVDENDVSEKTIRNVYEDPKDLNNKAIEKLPSPSSLKKLPEKETASFSEKAVMDYLMGSVSEGATTSSMVEYIIAACKKKAAEIASEEASDALKVLPTVSTEEKQNKPKPLREFYKQPENKQIKSLKQSRSTSTKETAQTQTEGLTPKGAKGGAIGKQQQNSAKTVTFKVPRDQRDPKRVTPKMGVKAATAVVRTSTTTSVTARHDTEQSIIISEYGKTGFVDTDVNSTTYDDFKRPLLSTEPESRKKQKSMRQSETKVVKSLIPVRTDGMNGMMINADVLPQIVQPIPRPSSAFVPLRENNGCYPNPHQQQPNQQLQQQQPFSIPVNIHIHLPSYPFQGNTQHNGPAYNPSSVPPNNTQGFPTSHDSKCNCNPYQPPQQ